MPKVLITFATKHATTKEIAETIAATLGDLGLDTDCRPAGDVADVTPYDAVVIGTPIYAGRILKDAVAFAGRHRDALKDRKVAAFVIGMSFKDGTPEAARKGSEAMDPIRRNVELADLGMFAGRMNPAFVPLVGRFMKYDESKTDDARDWDAIRAWARALPAKLGIEQHPGA
jgi:menaquinone-dependent protoporphyrinogen oxidase